MIRVHTIDRWVSTATLVGVARPLACSVAIHLGLGALVVAAGSAGLAAPQSSRVVWLALTPAEVPPPAAPVPLKAATRPRPAPIAPRKPAPVLDEPAPSPAPPIPTPPAAAAREVAAEAAPAPSAPSPSPSIAASSKASEPDSSPTAPSSPAAPGAGAPADVSASSRGPERGADGPPRSAVASRTPDTAPGGPIVRAARPRGGYQVRPTYPDSARRAGIQGTTLLRIYIEPDGRVSNVSVERSAGHQGLDQAAADAVRRWRFEPAQNSAGAVSVWALVPVEFRIGDRD